jgi:hypothetical protein
VNCAELTRRRLLQFTNSPTHEFTNCRDKDPHMPLKSEFEATCPCCRATLVIDVNLRRIVRHVEPPSGEMPELSNAERLVEEQARRREDLFQQSVAAERTRGDALSKRFEEALRQANTEPITKPTRDFDLD